MPSRIFRFYSLEPRMVFDMAAERWRPALVRRDAWKAGGSPVWYTKIVLDDERAADEFEFWLARNAPKRDIRSYVSLGARGSSGNAYQDVPFHRGRVITRLKFALDMFRQRLVWVAWSLRRLAFRFWQRFRS
jgi:hypothetical protein